MKLLIDFNGERKTLKPKLFRCRNLFSVTWFGIWIALYRGELTLSVPAFDPKEIDACLDAGLEPIWE